MEGGREEPQPYYPEQLAHPNTTSDARWKLGLQGMILGGPWVYSGNDVLDDNDGSPAEEKLPMQLGFESVCGTWAVTSQCSGENHHQVAKSLYCNQEWCDGPCGGNDSPAHNRRKASWLPKAQQISWMGHWVLTIPPEIRDNYRTKKELAALGIAGKRMFQRHGYDRGLRRWHFFGEDHPGRGLQGDGLPPYHPHLEVLVEGGFLSQVQIQAMKQSWANILGVSVERVNLYYEYVSSKDIRRKLHRISYALRPTFLDWRWDLELSKELKEFRNANSWRIWKYPKGHEKAEKWLPAKWDVPDNPDVPVPSPALIALGKDECPRCSHGIKWARVVSELKDDH